MMFSFIKTHICSLVITKCYVREKHFLFCVLYAYRQFQATKINIYKPRECSIHFRVIGTACHFSTAGTDITGRLFLHVIGKVRYPTGCN